METCFCKIHTKDQVIGTGFFCKIPFPQENNKGNLLPVLITNNHILGKQELSRKKEHEQDVFFLFWIISITI